MAVKHLEKQVHQEEKKVYDITSIIQILEAFNAQVQAGAPLPSGSGIVHFCEYIVRELGQVQTPRDTVLIKTFREDVAKVFQYLTEICESNSDIQEDIVTGCLKVLYSLIINPAEPYEAVSVVLQFFDNSQIPRAVNWLLNNYEQSSDVALTRGFKVLCNWLRVIDFTTNLHVWIIEILNGLREKQKYDLLIDLSLEVIEPLFKRLVLPMYLPKVAPVVQRILTSIRHTPVVFHKILKSVPLVLQVLRQEKFMLWHQRIIQDLVDTFAALILTFPGYDDLYRATEVALAAFSTSPNFRMILDVPAWHAEITRSGLNARVGLVNLGNTCYMNSVLQALVMTKQFSREILLSESKTPLLLKIQQLLALLLHSTRPELTPRAVLHATRPPGFQPGFQQDSSEFLGHLLETLHEQERQSSVRTKPEDDDVTMNEAAAICPQKSNNHNSLIQKTFGGKICITYECINCGEKSTNSDTFRDISLSFPDEKTEMTQNYSVQDLLDYYCSSEKLDGANQYFCEKCKRLCDGVRSIDITQAPQNLILTLKHFKYDQKYHVRAKLMHKVFHDESVALKVFADDSYQQPAVVKYVLYAAVVHSGVSMDSGHYYTYAADQECWYKFNDSFVNKCSVEDLHNLSPPNTPYILFYRRESPADSGASNPVAGDSLVGLEELPGHLKEFIIKDNVSYYDEVKLEAQKRKSNMNVSIVLAPKNQRDSDDEPPPNNCGGNAINSYNRFII
ncbi:ubiquitin carboxyl-terminal hydrolase 38 [Phlebotomus argentipes]|uniref:ubiquitin carboxyl-terminal hydrolase 38 n=1 Tax=Phlebotomus argentipes TaxID=94469 RepID=UPI002892F9CA|nr:ubiquitin carboxyl-terminal hydrolase 38 [Phlebotomus argentipes]